MGGWSSPEAERVVDAQDSAMDVKVRSRGWSACREAIAACST
jgi:hypothetical protein